MRFDPATETERLESSLGTVVDAAFRTWTRCTADEEVETSDSLTEIIEALTELASLNCCFIVDQSKAIFWTFTAVSSVSDDREVVGCASPCFLSSLAALKSLILGELNESVLVSADPGVRHPLPSSVVRVPRSPTCDTSVICVSNAFDIAYSSA